MHLPAVLLLVYCTYIHFVIYRHLFLVTFGSHLHPPSLQELAAVSKDERVPGSKENAEGLQGTELEALGGGRGGSLELCTTLRAGAAHASLCSSWGLPALK